MVQVGGKALKKLLIVTNRRQRVPAPRGLETIQRGDGFFDWAKKAVSAVGKVARVVAPVANVAGKVVSYVNPTAGNAISAGARIIGGGKRSLYGGSSGIIGPNPVNNRRFRTMEYRPDRWLIDSVNRTSLPTAPGLMAVQNGSGLFDWVRKAANVAKKVVKVVKKVAPVVNVAGKIVGYIDPKTGKKISNAAKLVGGKKKKKKQTGGRKKSAAAIQKTRLANLKKARAAKARKAR